MIYYFISIVLDLLLSSFISSSFKNINMFFPMILVSSLPILYATLKNKKLFFILLVITGIIYDALFSDVFLVNSYFFVLYGLFINSYYEKHDYNIFSFFIISILGVVFYDIFVFFLLIFIDYSSFEIDDLYYKIIRSIFVNVLYILLSIIILKSRIFWYKKRKKMGLKNHMFHSIF